MRGRFARRHGVGQGAAPAGVVRKPRTRAVPGHAQTSLRSLRNANCYAGVTTDFCQELADAMRRFRRMEAKRGPVPDGERRKRRAERRAMPRKRHGTFGLTAPLGASSPQRMSDVPDMRHVKAPSGALRRADNDACAARQRRNTRLQVRRRMHGTTPSSSESAWRLRSVAC